jgi:hypothetical protein
MSLLGGTAWLALLAGCGRIGYDERGSGPNGVTPLDPGQQVCVGTCVCETGGCDIVCEGDCLVNCPPGMCTMACLPHFKCNLECDTGRWGASGNGITFRGSCP